MKKRKQLQFKNYKLQIKPDKFPVAHSNSEAKTARPEIQSFHSSRAMSAYPTSRRLAPRSCSAINGSN